MGFLTVCPDLYEGESSHDPVAADLLRRKKRKEPTYRKVVRAAAWVSQETGGRPVGVVGFSYGGHWALWLAANPPVPIGAAVVFYAVRTSDFHGTPIQAHFAEDDAYVTASGRARFEKALPSGSEVFSYPGAGHWFFEMDQAAYDPASAALAWERMGRFLRSHLE
jgi:carboxymethylenebutenolidase